MWKLRKILRRAFFSSHAHRSLNNTWLFLKTEIAQYWLLTLICFFQESLTPWILIKELWVCSWRPAGPAFSPEPNALITDVSRSLLGPQYLPVSSSQNHCDALTSGSGVCFNPLSFIMSQKEDSGWANWETYFPKKTKTVTFKILSDLLILFSVVYLLVPLRLLGNGFFFATDFCL